MRETWEIVYDEQQSIFGSGRKDKRHEAVKLLLISHCAFV